ncbi:MAG: OmpA family protein [Nitrospirota bacterium]
MRNAAKFIAIFVSLAILSGCFVTTGKYQDKVREAENYKSALDKAKERVAVLEKVIASLDEAMKAGKDAQSEIFADLMQKNKELMEAKGDLSKEMERLSREKEEAISKLRSTYDNLVKNLQKEIKEGEIKITQIKDKLSVNMVEKILFDSGKAEIKPKGKEVLKKVGDILKSVPDKQIRIEGHTDNVPIGPGLQTKYPTNWELSTARATTVARFLQDKADIDPNVLVAAGYSEYRPVAANDTDEGKAQNRRIEIALIPIDIDRVLEEK